jgi:hypothetical protein
MQGAYRILDPGGTLVESFVAAPGPMGWRWFGRVSRESTGVELWTVDHVVDLEWSLVRFRLAVPGSAQTIVVPSEEGLVVLAGDRELSVPGARAVWSRSPSSLLVVDRRLNVLGAHALPVVRVPEGSQTVVALRSLGEVRVQPGQGEGSVRRFEVQAGEERSTALIRSDVPLSLEGAFELIA